MTTFQFTDPLLRRLVYAVGIMGVIAFGFYTFSLLRGAIVLLLDVLMPFLLALLLAYILAPMVVALQSRLRLGRIMGTLVLYLLICGVFFVVLAFLIPTVITEFVRLFHTIKEAVPGLLEKLASNSILPVDRKLTDIIKEYIASLDLSYDKIASQAMPGLRQIASGGVEALGAATRGLFTGVGSVANFLSFLVFVGIINFYFIVDWEKIRPTLRMMVPPRRRERLFDIMDKIDVAVGGFLRGQITVSLIVGSLFAVGLFGMGFIGFPALRNYSFLIGTASAIGGFVPYLGPVMGVTPAIVIVLLTAGVAWKVKVITLLAVLVLFALIQAVEGFVLQPRIVGKGAGLHPLAVMFALLFGGQFGIGGMIVAVPGASVIRVLFREFYWLPIERREAELAKRDAAPSPSDPSPEADPTD